MSRLPLVLEDLEIGVRRHKLPPLDMLLIGNILMETNGTNPLMLKSGG